MKPDWKDAPEWARWLVVVDDAILWFRNKPKFRRSKFFKVINMEFMHLYSKEDLSCAILIQAKPLIDTGSINAL